jgi:hypothetical protein
VAQLLGEGGASSLTEKGLPELGQNAPSGTGNSPLHRKLWGGTGKRGSTGRQILTGVGKVFAVVDGGLKVSCSWRSTHKWCKTV